MITVRKSNDRGHADHGWLNSFHTFSFAGYRDPAHMGFRSLRVINEDNVVAGQGFGTHAHHDMEIVTYVLDGELEHKDSMGNGEILRPGEFQRITAGTGITHSEFNPSPNRPSHFYQIWILPERKGIDPSYEQRAFDSSERQNRFQLVASPDGKDESLLIHQDVQIFLADVDVGASITWELANSRHVWLQVLRGSLTINDRSLHAGDAVAVSDEDGLSIHGDERAELMLFDLA